MFSQASVDAIEKYEKPIEDTVEDFLDSILDISWTVRHQLGLSQLTASKTNKGTRQKNVSDQKI